MVTHLMQIFDCLCRDASSIRLRCPLLTCGLSEFCRVIAADIQEDCLQLQVACESGHLFFIELQTRKGITDLTWRHVPTSTRLEL